QTSVCRKSPVQHSASDKLKLVGHRLRRLHQVEASRRLLCSIRGLRIDVADAANRLYSFNAIGVVAQFLTRIAHVSIDAPVIWGEVSTEDRLYQVLARDDAACRAYESFQKIELYRGERKLLAAP